MRVKICGITSLEDAMLCVNAGADALGFVLAPSPREIAPRATREIIEKLPPWIATAGVFQDESPDKIRELKAYCGFTWIQLHGSESVKDAAPFSPFVIKAIRRPGEADDRYPCSAFLLDQNKEFPMDEDQFFKMAGEVKTRKPLILAGGLTPENLVKVKSLNLYGVDAARGVESSPGKKDPRKVKNFISKAKGL